jgi:hypothetical protein
MNQQGLRSTFSKLGILACFLGPSVMISADILTIILNRNANPFKQTISDFAIGPYGWLEKIGMVMVAISFLFIAISLLTVKNVKESSIFRLVGVLFIIVAFGFLMISIFNTNIIGTIRNFHGLVHQIATIAVSVVFYLSCLSLMLLTYNRTGLRFFSFYCGFTFLAGFIFSITLLLFHRQNEYMGSLERIIAGFNLVWIVLVGPQVIRLVRSLQEGTL